MYLYQVSFIWPTLELCSIKKQTSRGYHVFSFYRVADCADSQHIADEPDLITNRVYPAVTPSRTSQSRKSHVSRFSRNGVGRGYLVAVTGSTWLLQGLCSALFYEFAMRGSHGRDLRESVTVALYIDAACPISDD